MEISADLLILLTLIIGLFVVNRYMNQQQAASQALQFEALLAQQSSPELDIEGRFAAVSAQQMQHNTEQLLVLAEQRMKVEREKSSGELKSTKEGIEHLIKPIVEQLGALKLPPTRWKKSAHKPTATSRVTSINSVIEPMLLAKKPTI